MATLIAKILQLLLPWALSKLVEWASNKDADKAKKDALDKAVKKKLDNFNEAFREAVNGEPMTSEQREKLKNAIRDLTRSIEYTDGV